MYLIGVNRSSMVLRLYSLTPNHIIKKSIFFLMLYLHKNFELNLEIMPSLDLRTNLVYIIGSDICECKRYG